MTDKALTVTSPNIPMVADAMSLADAFARSGFFSDATSQAQAIVKIQAGRELGIPPVAAMTGINIVKNKVVIGANILAGLIKRHPAYDYQIVQLDNELCDLVFFENGKEVGHSIFTIEDAHAAAVGAMTPPGKTSNMLAMFTRNMLFARAVSNGMRWYCPDVTSGIPVYTPGELDQPVDDEGNMSLWATEEQREAIKSRLRELFPEMQFTNDGHYNYMLKRHGYPKLSEMAGEQAVRVLETLGAPTPTVIEQTTDGGLTYEDLPAEPDYDGNPMDADTHEIEQAAAPAPGRDARELTPPKPGQIETPDFSKWRLTEWARFYSLAKVKLAFTSDEHAKNAVKQIFPNCETEMPAYADAWALLIQHQREAGRL